MRPCVLSLDPGKTTGWAFYDTRLKIFSGGQTDFDETWMMLGKYAATYGEDLDVIAERFVITPQTPKNTPAPWSLEIIGVARYVTRALCGQDLILFMQGSAKRFGTNDRLKALSWYGPGLPHMNDASRGLLTHLVERDWWDESLGERV